MSITTGTEVSQKGRRRFAVVYFAMYKKYL
jgi:hypothetical protein